MAGRIGARRPFRRGAVQHGNGGVTRQTRRGSDAREAMPGAGEMPMKALAVLGAGCLVLGACSGFYVPRSVNPQLRTQNQNLRTQNLEPRTAASTNPARALV